MNCDGMDRALAPEVRRQDRRRRVLQIAMPVLVLALLVVWLPGWMRPSVSRARDPHGPASRPGPIEAVDHGVRHGRPRGRARALEPARRARAAHPRSGRARSLKQGDPVVELDVSESVLALEKVVKDLKIKDNQQAQTRLTLEKSLVDLDGTLEVKALELAVRAGAARRRTSSCSRRACSRARRCAVPSSRSSRRRSSSRSCATSARTPSAPPAMQLEGLSLERGSLDKEAAQARRLLDLSTTKSDRDGVLTWVLSQEGALVRRGDVIARIADLTSFRVEASVSDVHAGRLRTGHAGRRPRQRPGPRRARSPKCSRRSRTASSASRWRWRSRRTPACGPACATDVLVITDRKPRALARQARAVCRQRRASGVRGPRRPRGPRAGRAGPLRRRRVEVVSGVAEGDEVIISDMRDYLHLSEVRIR